MGFDAGMWRFMLWGFPVAVEPWFWLTAAILGGITGFTGSEGLILILLNVIVVFVSVMVHELGHGFAVRHFGADAEIVLHGFGGACISRERYSTRTENVLISLAGPAAGFALALVLWPLLRYLGVSIAGTAGLLYLALQFALWVNFFWSLFNLLPVLPLDGGNIFRELMGPLRMRQTYLISGIVAVLVCVWAIATNHIFIAVMMGFFAFMSFRGTPPQVGVQYSQANPRYESRPRKPAKILAFEPGGSVPPAEVDRILEKVAASGISSLTTSEKKLLEKHSADLKKRAGGK